ncbi:hypothetical protein [Allohahella marinimesophila]|uniref:Holin-like protein n=1 Tax=Allohahella marinimesophila TaxID=1054972 RepID=A0ABP7Q844_9GAMM
MNTISPSAEASASVEQFEEKISVLLLQILAYAVMLYPVAYLVGMVAGTSLDPNITWLISIVAAFVVSRVLFDPTKSSKLVRRALGFVITPFASHLSSVSSRTAQLERAVLTMVGFGGVTAALYTMTLLASFNGLMVRYS